MKRLTLSCRRALPHLFATASILTFIGAAAALEPTPPQRTDAPPPVTTQQAPAPARLIVKYVETDGPQLESTAAARTAAETLSRLSGVALAHVRTMSGNAQVVEVVDLDFALNGDATQTLERIAARIAQDPRVEYVEPDEFNFIQQAVNDPRYGQQWHYTEPTTGIDLPTGWDHAHGQGVVVAVIDTGFRPHPDLQGNLLPGFDFISNALVANDGDLRDSDASDPGDWHTSSDTWCPNPPRNSSWHGTHVAGTVAAVTDNAEGVAGVARGANIVPVRVLGRCGGLTSDIIDGMRWAAGLPVPGVPTNPHPARVLNLSLGGGGACSAAYQDAIDDVVALGVTIVVAAGNSNADAANFRPASCNGVIAVAATNIDGARSYYSNFGSTVEIAAPGGETYAVAGNGVLSTWNTGTTTPASDDYTFYQGTSMASPHVAGVAALLYELNPTATPADILSTIQSTATPFPTVASNQCSTANCGAGIVDAGRAAKSLKPSMITSTDWLPLLLSD